MTQYFGVIGNRDYIKIRGFKRPFWEFLDRQPDGWLSSLVYQREDVPEGRMIWDCGAWSYRNDDNPKWDADSVVAPYLLFSRCGDILVAPDHMLIGNNDAGRRESNRRNAARFLQTCPGDHTPMAVAHGTTVEERVDNASELARIGYQYIALGSMAANAARKALMIDHARAVRHALPSVYVHILGLSSPPYMAAWTRMGINSADGSSHFKQAFTGGAFFSRTGAKLIKHSAARGDEEIAIPPCDCGACATLRSDGVDTRRYGSNESNMGRAAHNLNMLMAAQREAMLPHIVLVACCGAKTPHKNAAKDLYQSPLFKKSRRYAERVGDAWYILSAKHGLLDPDEVIEPYDDRLSNESRPSWTNAIAQQLRALLPARFTVLAGKDYCGWIDAFDVILPMQSKGIGERLAWLDSMNAEQQTLALA